jgi:hypothetical protein
MSCCRRRPDWPTSTRSLEVRYEFPREPLRALCYFIYPSISLPDDSNSPTKVLLPFLLNVDYNSETPAKLDATPQTLRSVVSQRAATAKNSPRATPLSRQVVVRNAVVASSTADERNGTFVDDFEKRNDAATAAAATAASRNDGDERASAQRSKFETKRKATTNHVEANEHDNADTENDDDTSTLLAQQQRQRALQPLKRSKLDNNRGKGFFSKKSGLF